MRVIAVVLLVVFSSTSVSAQIFPRLWNRGGVSQGNCPGGVCPTGTQWTNRDGLSPRAHLEQVHGTSTVGMSSAEVRVEQSRYHNQYGAGHPVRAYQSAQSVQSYGSSGSSVVTHSGGSSGAIYSQSYVVPRSAVVSEPAALGAEYSVLANSRTKFRKNLLAAAKRARDAGTISDSEHFQLVVASLRPRKLEEMQAACHEMAVQEGLATATAIDWDALIEFIEKLIPLIIKLIDLFGANHGPGISEMPQPQYAAEFAIPSERLAA